MTDDLKLIERLREESTCNAHLIRHGYREADSLMSEAANAIERLTRELHDAKYYTVPLSKDGNWVFIDGPGDVELDHGGKMRAEIERLAAQVEEMREALEPFANECDGWPAAYTDDENLVESFDDVISTITLGDCRRARALLSRTQEQAG